MSNEDQRIERLKGENYFIWASWMKMVLMGKGYWRMVERKNRLPANASAEEEEVYEQKVHAALYLMMNALNDPILGVATCCYHPKELWDRLEEKYEAL